jgi:hypothetical protein
MADSLLADYIFESTGYPSSLKGKYQVYRLSILSIKDLPAVYPLQGKIQSLPAIQLGWKTYLKSHPSKFILIAQFLMGC